MYHINPPRLLEHPQELEFCPRLMAGETGAPQGGAGGAIPPPRRHVVGLVFLYAVALVLLVPRVDVCGPEQPALAITASPLPPLIAILPASIAVNVQSQIPPGEAVWVVFNPIPGCQDALEVPLPPEQSPPSDAAIAASAAIAVQQFRHAAEHIIASIIVGDDCSLFCHFLQSPPVLLLNCAAIAVAAAV
jgi:hypothetical protein